MPALPGEMGTHDLQRALLAAAVGSLTARQQHVLAVLGETDSMKEAAERLGVHPAALTSRLRAIAHRLGLATSQDLVALARRRHLLDICVEAIFGLDTSGICVFANQRACELVGYKREDIVGRNAHLLVHGRGMDGEEQPVDGCPVHDVLTGNRLSCAGETVIWHRAGHPLWVRYSAEAAGDPGDDLVTVITVHDVSEQVRSERQIRLGQIRLELALGAVGVCAFEMDLRAERLYGLSDLAPVQDGVGVEDFLTVVHPEDRYLASLEYARSLPPDEVVNSEIRLLDDDGYYRLISAHARMVTDQTGSPSLLLGVARDITAERDQERVRQAVLELSTDAYFGWNEDGRLTDWNRMAADIFGYPAEEAKGRLVEDLIVPERYRNDRPAEPWSIIIPDEPAAGSGGPVEVTARRADGRELPFEMSVTAVPLVRGTAYRALGRDITARKAAESRLLAHALTDELTGLANRALLEDRIQRALGRRKAPSRLAVLSLDLDRFRLVNDTLGHGAGDDLLREVAARIQASVGEQDTVARFAGDQFIVAGENMARDDALELARRLVDAIQAPTVVHGRELRITASVGVVLAAEPNVRVRDVLSDAEVAMFRAKRAGRGSVEVFDETTRGLAGCRLEMEADLHRAVAADELRVLYQPVVDLATGEMAGVEALVRWQHPARGLLAPAEFMELAEETGLIVPIGAHVLRTACRDLGAWKAGPNFHVSVNVAPLQLAEPSIVETVEAILAQTGTAATQLCLEITETGLMEETAGATIALQRMTDLGISLAVDDFGTGYSSLLRLRRFPVSILKLDQQFVSGLGRHPDDTAIVKASVDLAQALGLDALAEGVEREDQIDLLRTFGCEFAQGYWWSEPVPADEIATMLAGRSELEDGLERP